MRWPRAVTAGGPANTAPARWCRFQLALICPPFGMRELEVQDKPGTIAGDAADSLRRRISRVGRRPPRPRSRLTATGLLLSGRRVDSFLRTKPTILWRRAGVRTMERVLVRTCSADQATVLARAAGRFAPVAPARVPIYPPTR